MKRSVSQYSELEWVFQSVLKSVSPLFQKFRIEASFYPYVGLTHTIRRKAGGWVVRISDHCRRAPRPVLEAIANILAFKVLRKPVPHRFVELYEDFRNDPEIEFEVRAGRLARGNKRMSAATGRHYQLREIYDEVNQEFFGGRLEIERVGWGRRRGWGRIAHYDSVHHTITVSPVLDHARVPRSVIAFVMYHEMLHILFSQSKGRSRIHHSREFRQAEEAYPGSASAKEFLNAYCRAHGRKFQIQ